MELLFASGADFTMIHNVTSYPAIFNSICVFYVVITCLCIIENEILQWKRQFKREFGIISNFIVSCKPCAFVLCYVSAYKFFNVYSTRFVHECRCFQWNRFFYWIYCYLSIVNSFYPICQSYNWESYFILLSWLRRMHWRKIKKNLLYFLVQIFVL